MLACVNSAPLGLLGRARGVEDHRGLLGRRHRRFDAVRRARQQRLESFGRWRSIAVAEEPQAPAVPGQRERLGAPAAQLAVVAGETNQGIGIRIVEVVGDLAHRRQRADRDHRAADRQHGVVDDDEFGPVRAAQRDVIAGAEARRAQTLGDAADAIGQPGITQPARPRRRWPCARDGSPRRAAIARRRSAWRSRGPHGWLNI